MANRLAKEKNVTQHLGMMIKAIQAHSKVVDAACGFSSIRLRMLYEVNKAPGIKVSDLASLLSNHRSICSNTLDKLEEKHLLYRNRSKSDQRAVRLYLTDEGKFSSTQEKLSAEQLDDLERSLGLLVDSMQYDDEKAVLTHPNNATGNLYFL